jgi:hypothetical protein
MDSESRTDAGDIGHILHGARQRTHHADNKSDSRENHSTSAVLSDCVHHDTECQDVASHDENGKEQLADTEKFSPKGSHKYVSRVGQVLNVRI